MEKVGEKTRETLRMIDKIEKLYQTGLKKAAQLQSAARSNKRLYVRDRNRLLRTRVEMSLLVRSIHFNEHEKKRLIDMMRQTVEQVHSVEREIGRLIRRVSALRGDSTNAAHSDLRSRRAQRRTIEESNHVDSNT